jgi:hypothetical protein
MENGLQVIKKKFNEIKKIYLLEFFDNDEKLFIIGSPEEGENWKLSDLKFIIWDLCNTGKHELIELDNFPVRNVEDLGKRLARTSGNILQIGDDGTVSSVLKKVENRLRQKKENDKKEEEKSNKANADLKEDIGRKTNGEPDENHIIKYNQDMDFKPIVNEKEPWVLGDYKRTSFCLYQHQDGTKIETLQLIVGRTTVQIWHQIRDDSKNGDEFPNKGDPFLEYIWTNRISVNQEREETRLQIENFEYGQKDKLHDKLTDFTLVVYWYVRVNEDEKSVKNIIQEDDEGKKKSGNIRRYVIKRKDVIEKFHTVRYACEALEHLSKRYKNIADNYIKAHKVS